MNPSRFFDFLRLSLSRKILLKSIALTASAVVVMSCLTSLPVVWAESSRQDSATFDTVGNNQCVEPTDVMRRDHMKFLVHQRGKTVHYGVRTKKHSLKGCVDCHVKRDEAGQYIPINDEEQFCQSCHQYASVKIDCFECHATTPDVEGVVNGIETSRNHSRLDFDVSLHGSYSNLEGMSNWMKTGVASHQVERWAILPQAFRSSFFDAGCSTPQKSGG